MSNKIGYILRTRSADGKNKFAFMESTFTRKINSRGDKIYSKMLYGSFDYCDIVDNANIMKDKSIILVGEPFLLDDDLRNNAIKWVERANSSDTACLDIV